MGIIGLRFTVGLHDSLKLCNYLSPFYLTRMSIVRQASTHKNLDNYQLISALAGGDRWALPELYEQHWFALYRRAFQKQIRTKAEELVQDVWQKRASLQVRQVMPYLFKALKYAVIDHIRHRVQQERLEGYQQQHQDGFRTTVPNTYSIIMT